MKKFYNSKKVKILYGICLFGIVFMAKRSNAIMLCPAITIYNRVRPVKNFQSSFLYDEYTEFVIGAGKTLLRASKKGTIRLIQDSKQKGPTILLAGFISGLAKEYIPTVKNSIKADLALIIGSYSQQVLTNKLSQVHIESPFAGIFYNMVIEPMVFKKFGLTSTSIKYLPAIRAILCVYSAVLSPAELKKICGILGFADGAMFAKSIN